MWWEQKLPIASLFHQLFNAKIKLMCYSFGVSTWFPLANTCCNYQKETECQLALTKTRIKPSECPDGRLKVCLLNTWVFYFEPFY